MWAELYGKAAGCGRGKAGSMHLVDTAVNMMGTSAIVASSIPDAVGYALAVKMRGEDRIVVCFFGEGATDEGVTQESLNFAALRRLPILFVCENNEYAIYSHVSARLAGYGLCERYRALRHPVREGGKRRFPGDARGAGRAIADVPRRVSARASSRSRPRAGATMSAPARTAITAIAATMSSTPRSPATRWRGSAALLADEARGDIDARVEREIAAAIAFAEASPFPEDKEIFDHVFAARTLAPGDRSLTYGEALLEATRQEMRRDPASSSWGRASTTRAACSARRSACTRNSAPSARFDVPLAEDGMTGVGIGAAMAGMRPIQVHQRMDFMLLCMNQLVNMAAKMSYMFAGATACRSWCAASSAGAGARARSTARRSIPISCMCRACGLRADHALRRQGLPDHRHPRRQSGDHDRAPDAASDRRPCAGRGL